MELNKENLLQKYIVDKLGTRECAKIFGVSQYTVCRKLKKFGIKSRAYTENKMPTPKGSNLSDAHKKAISDHHKNDQNWHMRGRTLEKHHNWKGGVHSYRRMKLSEVPLVCAICEQKEIIRKRTNLHVHHLDHDRSNNSLDNLQVLCVSCHKKVHNHSI